MSAGQPPPPPPGYGYGPYAPNSPYTYANSPPYAPNYPYPYGPGAPPAPNSPHPYGYPPAPRPPRGPSLATRFWRGVLNSWRVMLPGRPDRVVDVAAARAQIARTAIGLLATCWLIYAYRLQDSTGEVVSGKLDETLWSASFVLLGVPVALLLFVLLARPPLRSLYLRRLVHPLKALGALVGAFLTFLVLTSAQSMGVWRINPLLTLVTLPPMVLLFLYLTVFVLFGAVLGVTHLFRTADVHEVLPPLLTPVVVWGLFLFQLFETPLVDAPLAVRLLFLFGPPLSVTALSAWELRRLRTRHGITLRRAVNR